MADAPAPGREGPRFSAGDDEQMTASLRVARSARLPATGPWGASRRWRVRKRDTIVFCFGRLVRFDLIGADYIRDVKPGELIVVGSGGREVPRFLFGGTQPQIELHLRARFIFSRPDSVVYSGAPGADQPRKKLGRQLAREARRGGRSDRPCTGFGRGPRPVGLIRRESGIPFRFALDPESLCRAHVH